MMRVSLFVTALLWPPFFTLAMLVFAFSRLGHGVVGLDWAPLLIFYGPIIAAAFAILRTSVALRMLFTVIMVVIGFTTSIVTTVTVGCIMRGLCL